MLVMTGFVLEGSRNIGTQKLGKAHLGGILERSGQRSLSTTFCEGSVENLLHGSLNCQKEEQMYIFR